MVEWFTAPSQFEPHDKDEEIGGRMKKEKELVKDFLSVVLVSAAAVVVE